MDKDAFRGRVDREVRRWIDADPGSRTAERLAREAGISPATLSDVRRGAIPGADKIAALAVALGVSADYLLLLTDEPRPPELGASQQAVQMMRQLVEAVYADPDQLERIRASLAWLDATRSGRAAAGPGADGPGSSG